MVGREFIRKEMELDVDEDGNPKTVAAAIRLFHKNEKTKRIYCPKNIYGNPMDSLKELSQKQ